MLEYLELLNLVRECDVCLGPYLCNALGTPLEMFQVFKEFCTNRKLVFDVHKASNKV